MTISETVEVMECGAMLLKIFPDGAFGPSIISAFKGLLPQAEFMPTGGVSLENTKDWIHKGAVAVGTGSELTSGAKVGNYDLVAQTAARFLEEVKKARASMPAK